jgi:hypothetical protein
MALFLILAILSFNADVSSTLKKYSTQKEVLDLSNALWGYQNASAIVSDFDKVGYAFVATQRLMPFDYNLSPEEKFFLVSWSASLGINEYSDANDYLTLARVFLNDNNFRHAYDGTPLDVNVPTKLIFEIPSNGFDLNVFDTNTMVFDFRASGVNKVDINLNILYSLSDFNSILLNGGACPAYSTGNFYKISIIDSNCSRCAALQSTCGIATNNDFTFTLSCIGSCTSTPLTIQKRGTRLEVKYNSDKKIGVIVKTFFNDAPAGLVLKDTNISALLGSVKIN